VGGRAEVSVGGRVSPPVNTRWSCVNSERGGEGRGLGPEEKGVRVNPIYTDTHIYTYTYIYIYIKGGRSTWKGEVKVDGRPEPLPGL